MSVAKPYWRGGSVCSAPTMGYRFVRRGRMRLEFWVSLACANFSFSVGGRQIAGDKVWVRVYP